MSGTSSFVTLYSCFITWFLCRRELQICEATEGHVPFQNNLALEKHYKRRPTLRHCTFHNDWLRLEMSIYTYISTLLTIWGHKTNPNHIKVTENLALATRRRTISTLKEDHGSPMVTAQNKTLIWNQFLVHYNILFVCDSQH